MNIYLIELVGRMEIDDIQALVFITEDDDKAEAFAKNFRWRFNKHDKCETRITLLGSAGPETKAGVVITKRATAGRTPHPG